MANIAIFKAGQIPRYLRSVNTPEFSSDPDVIINPDITAVESVLIKYWKRSGNNIQEMNTSEKSAVDAAEVAAADAAIDAFIIDPIKLAKALFQTGNNKWAIGQTITAAQFKTLIKSL